MTDQRELMKKLVEAPYGKAAEILKENGLWDEKRAGPDNGEYKTYRVRVDGAQDVSSTITVEARSDEEAMELAEDIASDRSFSWRDCGDVEVWGSEVVSR